MKLILNFIFFGIVYFLLWHFFPVQFAGAVAYMNEAFVSVSDFIVGLISKVKTPEAAPAPAPAHSALLLPMLWNYFRG